MSKDPMVRKEKAVRLGGDTEGKVTFQVGLLPPFTAPHST